MYTYKYVPPPIADSAPLDKTLPTVETCLPPVYPAGTNPSIDVKDKEFKLNVAADPGPRAVTELPPDVGTGSPLPDYPQYFAENTGHDVPELVS